MRTYSEKRAVCKGKDVHGLEAVENSRRELGEPRGIEMAAFYELRLTIHFEKVDGLPARVETDLAHHLTERNTKFRKRFVVFRIQREA